MRGVALLPSLPLWDVSCCACLLLPQTRGKATIEHPHEKDDLPFSIRRRPSNRAHLEIRSCAPTPSIDTTMASGS